VRDLEELLLSGDCSPEFAVTDGGFGVEDDFVDLGRTGQENNVQEMCKINIGRMVQEGKVGEVFPHRNRQSSPTVEAVRRGPIRAARRQCWNEDRGETKRRLRPTYRRGLATDWEGIDGN
jgi:hypothetical protein